MSKQQCEQFDELLVDYADGVLEAEQAGKIAAHLQQCEQCRARIEALQRSLGLAQVIWQDNLGQTGQKGRFCFKLALRSRSWPCVAAAAVILFATAIVLHHNFPVSTAPEQLTIEQIEQRIMAEGSAARLLAAGDLLARKPSSQSLAKAQYKYILDYYPDTEAAAQARTKVQ